MPSLVVLGAVLMVAGGVLVLLQRKHTPRLRLSNTISVAGVGELDPLFTRIGQVDSARGRLDHAIDAVIPVRNPQQTLPPRSEVVRAYAAARERLVDFSRTYLRKPPSDPLTRFAALSRCVDDTLAHEEAPGEGTAAEAGDDLLRRLDYLGGALRWDRRRLPAAAPVGGELVAVVRDLQRAVARLPRRAAPAARRGPPPWSGPVAQEARGAGAAHVPGREGGGGGRRAAVAGRAGRGVAHPLGR
jgi:hypothetical protein